jgi:hypothetical protein
MRFMQVAATREINKKTNFATEKCAKVHISFGEPLG